MHSPALAKILRWLDVFLRGIHLSAVVLLGSAVLGAATPLPLAGGLVLLSGVLMLAIEIRQHPAMLFQWTGASLALKLALVAWMMIDPALRQPLFWLIVTWSAVFAHAPASFRHRRWL